MKKQTLLDIIITLLIIMFLYASFSKYFDYQAFKRAMYVQPFPRWFSTFLIFIIPPVEILTSMLLLFERTKKTGLWSSVILMTAFTLYISAILLHLFPDVPCTCGGVIKLLGWGQHLLFNLFFLGISITGLAIINEGITKRVITKSR